MSDPASDWGEFREIGQIPIGEPSSPPASAYQCLGVSGRSLVAAIEALTPKSGRAVDNDYYAGRNDAANIAVPYEAEWQARLTAAKGQVAHFQLGADVMAEQRDEARKRADAAEERVRALTDGITRLLNETRDYRDKVRQSTNPPLDRTYTASDTLIYRLSALLRPEPSAASDDAAGETAGESVGA